MSIFPLLNKYAQIEQGFHPVKKFSNHEPSLTEVDWGDHDSSFFLYLTHIDYDAKPKEFFTQELWGRTTTKNIFRSAHEKPECIFG